MIAPALNEAFVSFSQETELMSTVMLKNDSCSLVELIAVSISSTEQGTGRQMA